MFDDRWLADRIDERIDELIELRDALVDEMGNYPLTKREQQLVMPIVLDEAEDAFDHYKAGALSGKVSLKEVEEMMEFLDTS